MTSRRPMTRSYSGNGRTSSFEEEGSSSNREIRNPYLSNVRPENSYSRYSHYRPPRSTLCSVMAQLTEDIQPSFETTLKSKAVSEKCNVKFTCVVTGYPAPELTWYKDDMQMDRYCGLPKYEIHRNGKNHTLQIYNCTLDDAAIYQASASNSKGIVSCSGVLEVGTMSEFLIHQRFFAKLKQKADNKRKELEDSKKQGKENVPREQPEGSPQRPPRKRPGLPPLAKEEPRAVEQIGAATSEPNGAGVEIEETAPQTPTGVGMEKVEDSPSQENVAKKKIKITNGMDGVTGGSRGRAMANMRQNSYDGGISLAQFLAETVSSQTVEEKQAEKTSEMDTSVPGLSKDSEREREATCREVKDSEKVNVLVQEHERLKVTETESPVESEREKERQTELPHNITHPSHSPATKSHRKSHKDHEHHNIQASISSVLHTVKDFFFGKGKKDSHGHRDREEKGDYNPATHGQPSPPQTPPPSARREGYGAHTEDVPMALDESREPSQVVVTEPHLDPWEPLTPHGVEHKAFQKELYPPRTESGHNSFEPRVEEASSQGDHRRPGEAVVPMSESSVIVEEKDKHLHTVSVTEEVPSPQKVSTVTLPQTQTPACGEASSPATLSFSTGGSAPLFSVTLDADTHGLEEVACDESLQAGISGLFKPQDDHSPSHPLMSEKVEAQAEIQVCSMNEYETQMETGVLAPSVGEQIVCDAACVNQVPIPVITIQAENTLVSDSMDIDYTSQIQTMNIEDLSTVTAVDRSEKADFQVEQGDVLENAQGCNLSVSVTSALDLNEGIVPLQEGLSSAFAEKVNSHLKIEDTPPLSEIESDERTRETSQRNEGQTLTIKSERGKEGEAFAEIQEDLTDSVSLPVAHTAEVGSRLFVENVSGSKTLNSIEDTTNCQNIKAIIPQIVSNGKIIEKGNEVKEPEIKEPMLPLIALPLITEPQLLQKDLKVDMPKVILKDNHAKPISNTEGLLPTEARLVNEDNNPPTDKIQEVVKLRDRTEIHRAEPQRIGEHGPHTDSVVAIPATNVPYTEENKHRVDVPVYALETAPVVNAPVNEAPKAALVVVPPISIICDDVSVETISVPSQHKLTVTGPDQAAQTHDNSRISVGSPSQKHTLNGALTPADVSTNTVSLIKATEGVGDAVTCEKKPMKGVAKEPDAHETVPVKDTHIQADKSPVDRLDVKALPTHAALSPASLRRFLSRAGPRSDSPTAVAVPAITVGDPQSDRTGGELSGGSTPTSSLSCESSPRLKRRDSLSLIRSATPEELASGARRKIFMPRAKGEDGGEGVGPGVQGVLDAAAKRETPYMSPSQARRAALLQAPAGQSTPPMERRSPLLNRRKATLEVPKAVEVKPAEEPDSNKSEDKPAESKIFMPRAKGEDGGEGVGLGVQLVPDTAAKRETPYMSPSQARRAALLQAPAGQSTPPMERRSPLLNRRKATLEVPKVVEVKPAEGPDSNKSEDKPAESKIFMPRAKGEDGGEGVGLGVQVVPDAAAKRETPYMSPSQARRAALLQPPAGQSTPPMERRSPLLNRRKATLEVPKVVEVKPAEGPDSNKSEDKPAEKEKLDPFKAPQVIRKIRGEPFPDASGHLKLWCQFFNILSDSTIKWYRDEEEILEVKRSGGDESQVALAIVQASSPDCGVYGCTIKNEYGTDTTDFLLSMDILADILLKEDLEVGEEIEMTPLRFTKGLADVGCWGEKFFGRIMTKESHMGEGCAHKACRAKVIYGLEPVFESGSTCIMKVQSPIPYGTKEDRNLAERNLEITKQECKIQNMIREYCKIFAAEARVIENFGFSLEVIPQYLMYRPANSVPYATVETDLPGVFLKYCMMDATGGLITRNTSEVEQKCCTFQHWIHQWTHGNLLVTHLQGVETKLTNIRVVTKSKGYQGLTEKGSPDVLEQFAAQHQCNYYCGLLDLRSLKIKGSRSPMLNRKMSIGSSPQLQRRGVNSPQTSRKSTSSPKVPRKTPGVEESSQTAKANNDGTSEMVLKR